MAIDKDEVFPNQVEIPKKTASLLKAMAIEIERLKSEMKMIAETFLETADLLDDEIDYTLTPDGKSLIRMPKKRPKPPKKPRGDKN
jgi:hypothetical protein